MKLFHKRHPAIGARPGTLVIADGVEVPRIRVIVYDSDSIDELQLGGPAELTALLAGDRKLWIDVHGTGDERIMREIADVLALHPLALEDVVNVPQRPKQELYDEQHLIITRMVQLRGHTALDVEQVGIVLGTRWVATFQERAGDVLDPIRQRLRSGKGPIRRLGVDYLGYAIFDAIVDGYYPVIESLGDWLERLEDVVMHDPSPQVLHQLSDAKTILVTLRRGLWPLRDAANGLARDPSPFISDGVRIYLRDVHDHCVQTAEVTESYRELVAGLMNTYLSVVSNRMNEIMKVLTIMASIFIPLTFLAGVYGMNFEHMPELHSRWSYPLLLAVMMATASALLLFFRRKGWLGGHADAGGETSTDDNGEHQ